MTISHSGLLFWATLYIDNPRFVLFSVTHLSSRMVSRPGTSQIF